MHIQFDRIINAPEISLTDFATARSDILAVTAFPRVVWRQIRSRNPNERLNREIRRRTNVVGILPPPTFDHSIDRRDAGGTP